MKHSAFAIFFIALATSASAGNYDAPADPPVMAPVVIEQAAEASSAPSAAFVLGLITLAVFGTAAASN